MKLVLLILTLFENSLQKRIFPKEDVSQPEIFSLHVLSHIQYRYAHTVVSSLLVNTASVPTEVNFRMVLPETAFISGFLMEVDNQLFNAYVKEKELAKMKYKKAVKFGKTSGRAVLSVRDSRQFTVSVHIEPYKRVTFNLTYEELLVRKLGVYKYVVNLDPGQIVPDLRVAVQIEDLGSIMTLDVPAVKMSDLLEAYSTKGITNPWVRIERHNLHSVIIRYEPNAGHQQEFTADGINGQFIIQYDLGRSSKHPSQLLVNNGYFVHFFAPEHLKPLPKHIIFVLDASDSMSGPKFNQLKDAIITILRDLRLTDYFSLIAFGTVVLVWSQSGWESEKFLWKNAVISANPDSIDKASKTIGNLETLGETNIHEALETSTSLAYFGRHILQNTSESEFNKDLKTMEPIIIFLTDGKPTAGVTNLDDIIRDTTVRNRASKAAIFTLALGEDADLHFLTRLSLRNSGFARKIYEASDIAMQLTNFYFEVASPLLTNVMFNYSHSQVDVNSLTNHNFYCFYSGSELVVAGRLSLGTTEKDLSYKLTGQTADGLTYFEPDQPISVIDRGNKPSFMEKLWAYLSIQQLLNAQKKNDSKDSLNTKQQAIDLALKYSFVTPVTSLIVVRPDGNDTRADTDQEEDEATFENCVDCRDVPKHSGVFPFNLVPLSASGSSVATTDLHLFTMCVIKIITNITA
ncbi:inter-alpha-trypsin inhibitor heavy chain H3-like [Periplaneta americana]|uniref:inter-alpha-trypsin inhibitor heavy chain H3-like n=1 Tax=Periplaneta americana TaxID=6978 RepID=UPI0037E71736